MLKARLIGSLIFAIIFCAIYYPMQTIGFFVILGIGYIIFLNLRGSINEMNQDYDRALRRRSALEVAQMYLSPYNDIWGELKLSNKFCSIEISKHGVIYGTEKRLDKTHPYRTFRIIRSHVHEIQDVWEMFCLNFDHVKTYDDIVDDCRLYKTEIMEDVIGAAAADTKPQQAKLNVEKLDINNCSEIELTALPGISIVMSKRVIKKREEIGGFKTINDFFLFIKVKPHMESQLRELVCVNKMKGSVKIERSKERTVDL